MSALAVLTPRQMSQRDPRRAEIAVEPGLRGIIKRALWRTIAAKGGWDGNLDTVASAILDDLRREVLARRRR